MPADIDDLKAKIEAFTAAINSTDSPASSDTEGLAQALAELDAAQNLQP